MRVRDAGNQQRRRHVQTTIYRRGSMTHQHRITSTSRQDRPWLPSPGCPWSARSPAAVRSCCRLTRYDGSGGATDHELSNADLQRRHVHGAGQLRLAWRRRAHQRHPHAGEERHHGDERRHRPGRPNGDRLRAHVRERNRRSDGRQEHQHAQHRRCGRILAHQHGLQQCPRENQG